MTQKEAFIHYFQRMDIDILELVLPDNIHYFGANKTEFLAKLKYNFNNFKLGGEKDLLKIEYNDKTSNTFYHISEIFDLEQEFIIEEKKGNILNISSSAIINSFEDFEMHSHMVMFFAEDEKADFIPSNEYVLKLHHCNNAFEEIVNGEIQILTPDDILYWVKKHKSLYKEIKNDSLWFKLNDFRNLFFVLEIINKNLNSHNKIKKALKSYDNSTNETMDKWLNDNDRLFFCKMANFETCFNNLDQTNKTLKLSGYSSIYFRGQVFFDIIKFNELYLKHTVFEPLNLEEFGQPF